MNRLRALLIPVLVAVWAFVTASLLPSCSSIDCPVQNTVTCSYLVCNAEGVAAELQDTLNVFTPRRDGTDTLLLNRSVKTKSFSIPMSFSLAEDTIVLQLKGADYAVEDTVFVEKTNEPRFESVDCQAVFFHTITRARAKGTLLEDVIINKASVDYDASTPHLHLLFKSSL
ncbi:MAG: DUF6452 family protein [Prevotella sp.]